MDAAQEEQRGHGPSAAGDDGDRSARLASQMLSIDLILENILSHLNRNTVLTCRLVCRRWSLFGSQQVQKSSLSFTFDLEKEGKRRPQLKLKTDHHSERKFLLSQLTKLMASSRGSFPCNSFQFSCAVFKTRFARHFLNLHGAHIKKLTLTQETFKFNSGLAVDPLSGNFMISMTIDKKETSIALSSIVQLLLGQCPRLEHFDCQAKIKDFYEKSGAASKSREGPGKAVEIYYRLKKWRPDFKFNLKFISIQNGQVIPEHILQVALQCSSHLREVQLEPRNLPCLLDFVNRLHLLKRLNLIGNELADPGTLYALEYLLQYDEGNWDLELLQLDGACLLHKPYLWPWVTTIINSILKGSSAQCRKLSFMNMECLREIQIPQMPKVSYLVLSAKPGLKSLPAGVTLEKTFPNLKLLVIETCAIQSEKVHSLPDLFNSLKRVEGVEGVFLIDCKNEGTVDEIRNMFPNAVLNTREMRLETGTCRAEYRLSRKLAKLNSEK